MDAGMQARPGRPFRSSPAHAAFTITPLLLSLWAGVVLAAETGSPAAAASDAAARTWAVSVHWENDAAVGDDRHYTNGSALSLSHTGQSWADPLFDRLPWRGGRRTVSYALGQGMFTPENTDRAIPDPADRPYAGVLAFALGLHADRETRYHGLKLTLGVAGPWALTGETQRRVHQLLNTTSLPKGWDSQLRNEPIVNLTYEHRQKYRVAGRADGWAVEVIPVVGLMAGNLRTLGHLGGQMRLGRRIPDDFGTTLLRDMGDLPPPRHHPGSRAADSALGVYLHAGVGGSLVLHDLTLDGNTVKESHSVDKKQWVPSAMVGAGIGNRHLLATFSLVFTGAEFEGQQNRATYGTVTLAGFF